MYWQVGQPHTYNPPPYSGRSGRGRRIERLGNVAGAPGLVSRPSGSQPSRACSSDGTTAAVTLPGDLKYPPLSASQPVSRESDPQFGTTNG